MAADLSSVVSLLLFVVLVPVVSEECMAYTDLDGISYPSVTCSNWCCGSCTHRYCCSGSFLLLSMDDQEDCSESYDETMPKLPIASIVPFVVVTVVTLICCFVCPCCCLYKMCRKPQPVIATSTHTVVTTTPLQYPQQPTASPGQPQSYQGTQYPAYQPVPVQTGYGAQPMPQGYGGQPMLQGYGGQPMPTGPYQGQPYTPGPPPPYHEAVGPGYPPAPMPYSQAAFTPGQPAYPLQPPAQPQPQPQSDPHPEPQPQPSAPDFLAQSAYNPAYPPPPPKPGY